MTAGTKYLDSLVTITEDGILFRGYGLLGGDRVVSFSDIEEIVIKRPTFWNGKWRWHGTGDFKTWFPQDYDRQKRDSIFVAHIRKKWWRIGFTVEDSSQVTSLLREKGLIKKTADILSPEVAEPRSRTAKKSSNAKHKRRTVFWVLVLGNAVLLPLIALCLYLSGNI
jgi:hypothetical protein